MNYAKKYKMTIQALSPIHIGTGDELSPFEYVITDNINGEPELHIIDLPGMISGLNQQQKLRFYDAVNKGADSVRYLRKFIRHNTDLTRFSLHTLPVCQNIWNIYQNKLDSQENQLIVNLFYRNTKEWQPVIPGSSIKGAIRTAIVSAKVKTTYEKSRRLPDITKHNWEGESLGYNKDAKRDPFRAISIEDITLPYDATKIEEIMVYNPHKKTESIQQFYEMTYSILDGSTEIKGQGIFTIYSGFHIYEAVTLPQSAEVIAEACRKFYQKRIADEHRDFYEYRSDRVSYDKDMEKASKRLQQEKYGPLEFPIRLGRFSHCESVTVDVTLENGKPLRNPKTPRYKNKNPLPWGTTRSLLRNENSLFGPLGWAKVRLEEMT